MPRLLGLAWTLCALLFNAAPSQAQPVSTDPRTGTWIAADGPAARDAGVFHFRRTFDLAERPDRFLVHVSADNRYRLFVNGVPVATGPARGDPMHWRYETVDIAPHLRSGRNVLAATVWNWGELRPLAQMTLRTGFLLVAGDKAQALVDSGPGWKVFHDPAYSFARVLPPDDGGYYAAAPGEVVDASLYPWGWERPGYDDSAWPAAKALSRSQLRGTDPHGVPANWQLVPRNIPPMEERKQAFARVRRATGIEPAAGFIAGGRPLAIPAHSKVSLLLDQDQLTMGYPVFVINGGAGASATITYSEALFDAKGRKGNRNDIEGRSIRGLRDRIRFDGGRNRRFQSLWLRTFRYVQLDIETAAEPLEIVDAHSIFTAYPFENRAAFAGDQPWIAPIWDLNWRGFRVGAYETFWDTPYYEQLQYVGDTRIESLLSVYLTGDDRLMRNAIELFDASRSAEGITASRYPSDPAQYIPPFSLWWVAMVHDYWMLRDDPAFVRRFLPGMRGVLDWYERHLDETGMLGPMPWWNFLDWNDAFVRGEAPGAANGHSVALTLHYAYALRQAAELEAAFDRPEAAARNRAQADRLVSTVRQRAWNGERGLFSDSIERQSFSQQTNVLAVLAGAAEEPRALTERVLSDPQLVQASYYFRFYVDEAMRQSGLSDRYLQRLDPWREMIRNGLTTTPETPDPSRSDSHAWSAHPNYHLLATVLGIRPASAGFRTVSVAPALGAMKRVEGRMPHPQGEIAVRLRRTGEAGIQGEVLLPAGVSGSFLWNGQPQPLKPGRNIIRRAS